ncbi:MAG: lipopolysaccharide biosynthesis protein [Candidatus Binataceae bacterium]
MLVRIRPLIDAFIAPHRALGSSTAEERSKDRYSRALLTALGSVAGKGVSVATMLISVPLTLHYLGTERYGMWMTISSLIGMFGFTDLGLGFGLVNLVAEADGKDDSDLAATHISNAFFLLSGIALILAIVFASCYARVEWSRLFNVSSGRAVSEAGPAMVVIVGCFLLRMPLSLVQRVQLGFQQGVVNDIWLGVGNVLGLVGLLVAVVLRAGLPWLALSISGGPVLALLVNNLMLFFAQSPELRPRWRRCDASLLPQISRLGLLFLVLQLAAAVAYGSDDIIIARMLGPRAVSQYAVPRRLFNIVPSLAALGFTALWPAYGEALSRGDRQWVRKTLVTSVSWSVALSLIVSVILVVSGRELLKLWVGSSITPSFILLAGLGCWLFLRIPFEAAAVFLSGISVVGFQVVVATVMSIVAVTAKILLVQSMGIAGVIWATVGAYFVCSAIPQLIYLPFLLNKISVNEYSATASAELFEGLGS